MTPNSNINVQTRFATGIHAFRRRTESSKISWFEESEVHLKLQARLRDKDPRVLSILEGHDLMLEQTTNAGVLGYFLGLVESE